MTVKISMHERIKFECRATGESPYEFFCRAYIKVRQKKPDTRLMLAYSQDFNQRGNVPPFMHSYYRELDRENLKMPDSLERVLHPPFG